MTSLILKIADFAIATSTAQHCNCGSGTMPSATSFFWAVYPILLLAFFYQVGLPTYITRPITDSNAYNTLWKLFATTHCYASVKTLNSELPVAQCFSVSSSGRFSRVFNDSSVTPDQKTAAHVVPGLWDGHGHLVQYGESLDSVSLFGATSMSEVQKRLVDYKAQRPETGTKKEWLRGVGWDQAHFDGQWPVAVSMHVQIDEKPFKWYRKDFD
jgi:hypothetical protein